MRKTQEGAAQQIDDAQVQREAAEAKQRQERRLDAIRQRWLDNLILKD